MIRRLLLLGTALAVLGPCSAAHANAYTRVLAAYQRTGTVPACKFSSRELSDAIKQEDTYGAEYFADFTNAIQSALESRAAGQCSAQGSAATGSGVPGSGSGSGSGGKLAPQHLGSLTGASGSGLPAPIVLMALIAAAVAVVGAGGALVRARGWDPAWAAVWRHACREAGYRISASWSELSDWTRSRRHRRSTTEP